MFGSKVIKCQIGEIFSYLLFIGAKSQMVISSEPPWNKISIAILLGMPISCLKSHVLLSFVWSNFHNKTVRYVTVLMLCMNASLYAFLYLLMYNKCFSCYLRYFLSSDIEPFSQRYMSRDMISNDVAV